MLVALSNHEEFITRPLRLRPKLGSNDCCDATNERPFVVRAVDGVVKTKGTTKDLIRTGHCQDVLKFDWCLAKASPKLDALAFLGVLLGLHAYQSSSTKCTRSSWKDDCCSSTFALAEWRRSSPSSFFGGLFLENLGLSYGGCGSLTVPPFASPRSTPSGI